MADATMLTASALLTTKGKAQAAERQEHNGKLSKGDVAILDSWLRPKLPRSIPGSNITNWAELVRSVR